MIPRTLSASSLQVAALCMDRWNSEYMNRGAGFSNSAADTGTAVHGGLENFVKAVYIDKTHAGLSKPKRKELLITFYMMSYIETFGTTDTETDEYKDGLDLTLKWFTRTDLESVTVETVEVKETIWVPFNHPDGPGHTCDKCDNSGLGPGVCQVPFNYLMDRVDQTGETTWEVVDYKTIRVPLQPDDLIQKIQARAYALAIQIKHPEATEIKVTFDQLRHEKISMWFSRDDNIAFWRFLCAETQRIVDLDENDIRPKLNAECGYCVKKFQCKLIQSNITNGGIFSLSPEERVVLYNDLKAKIKAEELIVDQLGDEIFREASNRGELDWEVEGANGIFHEVHVGSRRSRSFPAHQAAAIMGPELFAQMGNMTIANLEKIIKDPSLPQEMRDQLKSLLEWQQGGLSLTVKEKKRIL